MEPEASPQPEAQRGASKRSFGDVLLFLGGLMAMPVGLGYGGSRSAPPPALGESTPRDRAFVKPSGRSRSIAATRG
jgi:hypothetical protein